MEPTLARVNRIAPMAFTVISKFWRTKCRFSLEPMAEGELDEVCRPSGGGGRWLLPQLRQAHVFGVRASGPRRVVLRGLPGAADGHSGASTTSGCGYAGISDAVSR